jgi:MscS family membrane protein
MTILDAIYLGNPLKNYILFLVFIFLGVFFGKLVRIITTRYLRALASKTKTKFDDILLDALDMPLIILIFAGFFWYGLSYLVLPQKIGALASEAINVVVALSGVWFLVKFVDDFIIEFIIPLVEKSETKLDDHIIPPLRRLMRILIIIMGFLVILDNIGYDITTLLAGLGIGGLAVALASKETVENFIAGVLIILDKPFGIGDWIKFGSSEGIVEEVGIRSTRIRTFGDSLIVVPNANILRTEIENFSAMRKRRILISIGLTYDTPVEKLKRAKEIIKNILDEHHGVVLPIRITFKEFGDFSLNIRVEYFIGNLDFDYYLNTVDEINLKIKEEFEKEGIEMAFPTQTVYLKKDD